MWGILIPYYLKRTFNVSLIWIKMLNDNIGQYKDVLRYCILNSEPSKLLDIRECLYCNDI